jgi:hypothetical protein
LKNAPESYYIPKWFKQPIYPSLWIEKDSEVDNFRGILKKGTFGNEVGTWDWEIDVKHDGGYDGWEAGYSKIRHIVYTMYVENIQKKVIIFYGGDMDPSGDNMPTHLKDVVGFFRDYNFGFDSLDFGWNNKSLPKTELPRFRLGPVEIRRLFVTQDQIQHYNIPLDVDSAVERKLFGTSKAAGDEKDKKGDTRTGGFIEKYRQYMQPGDKLPPMAELDAMMVTEELLSETTKILNEALKPLFDEKIYKRRVKYAIKSKRDEVKKLLEKKVIFLEDEDNSQ